MSQKEAYRIGRSTGADIMRSNYGDFAMNGVGKDDAVDQVCETEADHYRQFSPFEFTAKEFNDSRNPDGVWEAYERGVRVGARKAWDVITA